MQLVFTVNHTNTSPKAQPTKIQTYEQKTYALGNHPILTIDYDSEESPKENDIETSMKTTFMYTLHQCAKIEWPFPKYPRDESQKNRLPWLDRLPATASLPDFTDVERKRYFLY